MKAYQTFSKYLSVIAATLTGVHFIRFLLGTYYPDNFTIGLSFALSTMYFISLTYQHSINENEKEENL